MYRIDLRSIFRGFTLFTLVLQGSSSAFAEVSVDVRLEKAQKAEETCCYEDAVALYREILDDDIDDNTVSLRLAQALYALGNDTELVETIKPITDDLILVISASYIRLKEPQKAVELLKNISTLTSEGQLQLGQALFQSGQLDEAERIFAHISDNPSRQIGTVYLAKIALKHHKPELALERLEALSTQSSPLRFEVAYLQGEAYFNKRAYTAAIDCFKRALPQQNMHRAEWSSACLNRLATCYLALADDAGRTNSQRNDSLNQAQSTLELIQNQTHEDDVTLLLGRCYLLKGQLNKDPEALAKATAILTHRDGLKTQEARLQALIYLAQAAESYHERDSLLRRLIDESMGTTQWTTEAWHQRGQNDLNEAERLIQANERGQAAPLLESALYCFQRAFNLAATHHPSVANQAAKLKVHTYLILADERADKEALVYLNTLIENYPNLIASSTDPDEFYYVYALIASRQQRHELESVNTRLEWILDNHPNGKFADAALFLLATRHFRQGDRTKAQELFARLRKDYPHSSQAGDALYWQARCLEAAGSQTSQIRELMTAVYTNYPKSLYAAEAYYSIYSPTEYLQGDVQALKHLDALPKLFPDSPFAVQALLLIGLDYKRTRYNTEGKVVRKRNWIKAIEVLQEAESQYESLYSQQKIPPDQLERTIAARHRAILERALANLSVANESEGAKRHIYLEYASEVLEKLRDELETSSHPTELLHPLFDECLYSLALAHTLARDDERASAVLDTLLARYEKAKVTRGYYLSRARYQQALIAKRAEKSDQSLELLARAEEAAKGNVLGTDERLELWIQRSECYRQIGQLDKAMLELSRVINDDSISSHRLHAMVLRAEIYELQGRPELAQRQLEATAKKGGPWARLAEEKLNKDYRYE